MGIFYLERVQGGQEATRSESHGVACVRIDCKHCDLELLEIDFSSVIRVAHPEVLDSLFRSEQFGTRSIFRERSGNVHDNVS